MNYPSELENRYKREFKNLEKANQWLTSEIIRGIVLNLHTHSNILQLQDTRGVEDEAIFRHLDDEKYWSDINPNMVYFELESERIFPFKEFLEKIQQNSFDKSDSLPLCYYIALKNKAIKISNKNKNTHYKKLSQDIKTYGDLPREFIEGIKSGDITIDPVADDALKTEGFINNISKICQKIDNRPFTLLVLGHFKNHNAPYIARVSEDDRCEIISLNSLRGYNDELFTNALREGIKKGLDLSDENFEPTLSEIINQKDTALCGVIASTILGSVDNNKPLKAQFKDLKRLMKGVINNKKSVRKLLARIEWWENTVPFRKVFENQQWKYIQHFTDEQAKTIKTVISQLLYYTCKIEPPVRYDLPRDPDLYQECQRFLNLFDIKVNDTLFLQLFNKFELSEKEGIDSDIESNEILLENFTSDNKQISEDIEIQKKQLQTALGLYVSEEIITKYNHPTPNIELQKTLIEKLKNEKEFLTDVLREFVYRGLGYHDPCDQTEITIKLLLSTGADPYTDHLSINYTSTGRDFIDNYAGLTTVNKIQRSTYSNQPLKDLLKNIPAAAENTRLNSIDIELVNLIHALMANYPNQEVMIRIIENLNKRGFKLEQLDLNLDKVINDYFQDKIKLEDSNPKKLKLHSAIAKVKLFINQRYYFINNLKSYVDAYQNPQISDEECIQFISENNEIAKKQLQIALGVGVNEEIPGSSSGRIVRQHKNKRLTLQAKLIEVISKNPDNQAFLSSVLRDFIIRPCDAAQIPCTNASKTVQLLVDAGADPTIDHIDIDYDSPGRSFNNYNAGMSLIEIVETWENADTLSKESNTENDLILETIRSAQKKKENTDEDSLYNLIHQIEYIEKSNHNNHIPLAEKIADSLVENYEDIESMDRLFEIVQDKYFYRELNDEKKQPIYLKAIHNTKEFLLNRKLYQKFKQAYENDVSEEEGCVEFISKDTETLKQQLQLALGLTTPQGEHLNQRLDLQKKLIEELTKDENNHAFLSCVLRDFIFFVCQGGKAPCENADITMKFLIEAGANPTISHVDYHYKTNHKDELNYYEGIPAVFVLDRWVTNGDVSKKMRSLAKHNASIELKHYFRHLLQVISLSHDKNLSKERSIYLKNLSSNIVRNFISLGIKTNDLASLIIEARRLNNSNSTEEENLESYREAEGLLLEAIYQKEHEQEHKLLRMIKISLIFSPLILPLIFTGIVAIIRVVKLKNTTFTVSAEDISLEKFKEKYSQRDDFFNISKDKVVNKIQQTYSTKFPVKKDGTTLRKAIMFNNKFAQPKWIKSHKKDKKLPSIFNGISRISISEESKLKNDIRIYRPTPSPTSDEL